MAEPQRIPFITYLSEHGKEVIDWVNGNIKTTFNPTGQIYDRLANQVTEEYPYGPGLDNNANRNIETITINTSCNITLYRLSYVSSVSYNSWC